MISALYFGIWPCPAVFYSLDFVSAFIAFWHFSKDLILSLVKQILHTRNLLWSTSSESFGKNDMMNFCTSKLTCSRVEWLLLDEQLTSMCAQFAQLVHTICSTICCLICIDENCYGSPVSCYPPLGLLFCKCDAIIRAHLGGILLHFKLLKPFDFKLPEILCISTLEACYELKY